MRLFLLIMILHVALFAASQDLYFPPKLGDTWETTDPAELNWCSDNLDSLQAFLEDRNSKAFIILKDGKIVVEWYFGQFNQDSLWYWASAGKTLRAFTTGIAQQEGHLSLDDPTSDYLGVGWTSLTPDREEKITIWHQLTMTSGLDDDLANNFCTDPECLEYLADPGTRWAYHNAPYTLLKDVTESATGDSYNQYFNRKVKQKTGMGGIWLDLGFNNIYFSDARSMARFGLLILNNGIWDGDTLLHDRDYFEAMVNPSQDINESYGYLWWLNGYDSFMVPGSQIVFDGPLIPTAPDDLIAGLGANDQKLYVVPSQNLVAIRLGNSAADPNPALSSFDELLWEQITNLECTSSLDESKGNDKSNILAFPNPVSDFITLKGVENHTDGMVQIQSSNGFTIRREKLKTQIDVQTLSSGIYFLSVINENRQVVFQQSFVKF